MNLILKQVFQKDGVDRVNTMKLKELPDGEYQIWVTNGEHKAMFKLHSNTAKELVFFLQRNIK